MTSPSQSGTVDSISLTFHGLGLAHTGGWCGRDTGIQSTSACLPTAQLMAGKMTETQT